MKYQAKHNINKHYIIYSIQLKKRSQQRLSVTHCTKPPLACTTKSRQQTKDGLSASTHCTYDQIV